MEIFRKFAWKNEIFLPGSTTSQISNQIDAADVMVNIFFPNGPKIWYPLGQTLNREWNVDRSMLTAALWIHWRASLSCPRTLRRLQESSLMLVSENALRTISHCTFRAWNLESMLNFYQKFYLSIQSFTPKFLSFLFTNRNLKSLLSSLHIFSHHCTFLHVKTSPGWHNEFGAFIQRLFKITIILETFPLLSLAEKNSLSCKDACWLKWQGLKLVPIRRWGKQR